MLVPICSKAEELNTDILRLSQNIQWHRLLHFRKYDSEVDSENFFLNKKGKENPYLELFSTLKEFKNQNQHIICRFPARYKWLNGILQFDVANSQLKKCVEYQKFLEKTSAQSLSVVFSSFHLNNPASVFGHTLLKISTYKQEEKDNKETEDKIELLDYGINYGATNFSSNPLWYALGGLGGYFKGMFTAIPYYYKVREYNDFESRDLWNYDLDLTLEEVQRAIDHIWEMGEIYFDYYFLTENCAYHILALIEAAAPRLKLVDQFYYYVIPAETIKALYHEKAVYKFSFRPSIQRKYYQKFHGLDPTEKEAFWEIVKSNKPELLLNRSDLSEKSQVKILDGLIDYFDYSFAEDVLKENPSVLSKKQKILLTRSKLEQISLPAQFANAPIHAPHHSHSPQRVGIFGQRNDSHQTLLSFDFRFALHDILDSDIGYAPLSRVHIFHTKAGYNLKSKKADLESFSFFDILSLNPLTRVQENISWTLNFGISDIMSNQCFSCKRFGIEAGAGSSLSLKDNFIFFAILKSDIALTEKNSDHSYYQLGLGPNIGALFEFTKEIKAMLSWEYLQYLENPQFKSLYKLELQTNFSSFTTKLEAMKTVYGQEKISLGILVYY
ncbi:MAG: hypothetical protein A2X86_09705 [Bdellovibrionales bacterium GWA2_49_15]|nr:MAG: hypothetical protein A2X86_09705 [Bdellovibrionales bacterium GWA2_49_15]